MNITDESLFVESSSHNISPITYYNVTVMQTWGKKCDVINFFSDAIVGGQLTGDKITEPQHGYKQYDEYPAGTFHPMWSLST